MLPRMNEPEINGIPNALPGLYGIDDGGDFHEIGSCACDKVDNHINNKVLIVILLVIYARNFKINIFIVDK